MTKPWLCAGDFNEIIGQDEKLGGALRSHNQIQLFREVIDECSFMDMGFVGSKYTWSKHFDNGGLFRRDWIGAWRIIASF